LYDGYVVAFARCGVADVSDADGAREPSEPFVYSAAFHFWHKIQVLVCEELVVMEGEKAM
jgi:hypothetical protein